MKQTFTTKLVSVDEKVPGQYFAATVTVTKGNETRTYSVRGYWPAEADLQRSELALHDAKYNRDFAARLGRTGTKIHKCDATFWYNHTTGEVRMSETQTILNRAGAIIIDFWRPEYDKRQSMHSGGQY